MSLECRCGGDVVVQDGTYSDDSMCERFKCPNCGGTGTMTITATGVKHFTGCLKE